MPYQGSKRRLATRILEQARPPAGSLLEPFAGSAAVTLAAAARDLAPRYLLGDSFRPLCDLWRSLIEAPDALADRYEALWRDQQEEPRAHYAKVRDAFNQSGDPALLLFLLARCVKSAVRFNGAGEFNQSADLRRRGTKPRLMREHLERAARLLRGRYEVVCGDFAAVLERATPRDLVYLDPPYQGISRGRDPRYHQQLPLSRLVAALEGLNARGIPYLLSYDGRCGGREYGEPLPKALRLTRVLLPAGRSSQATLCGRVEETFESLYLSPAL
jgi:DNA adenine methylase